MQIARGAYFCHMSQRRTYLPLGKLAEHLPIDEILELREKHEQKKVAPK